MKKKVIKFKRKDDIPKLDFKTNLFLSVIKAKKVSHPLVRNIDKKLHMYPRACDKHEVYVFKDYEEYKNFYLMYFDSIDDDLIDMAIVTHGDKGQVVASKALCNMIIVKKRVYDFYCNLTPEKCAEIYENGYMTALDAFAYWDNNNICPPAMTCIIEKDRCDFFNNCTDCRQEYASNHMQYEAPRDMSVVLGKVKRNKNNEIEW